MNTIKNITAVTEVFPEGQKCVGALLAYDRPVAAARAEDFAVAGRTIADVRVRGDGAVYIALSPDDPGAGTFLPGEAWEFTAARVEDPMLAVSQLSDLAAADGTVLPAFGPEKSAGVEAPELERFVRGSFQGLRYNLFIPRDYDPGVKYPLVQFIHDASVCSEDPRCALAQGVGALVWTTEEAQAKHPCFVLAPQFAPPTIVDDDWNVDHRLEVCKRLLDHVVSLYSIDADRLYTTGQSMGCMSSMVLNLRYPDLFAASLFVAGQWDERLFRGSGLQNKRFWFVNSMGDAKAFPGMNQILYALEQDGAKVAREVWRTGESQQTYREKAEALIKTGANMIYTPYDITTVANGWHSHGGEHHVNTWRHAYGVEAIRDWLFDQRKGG